MPSFVKVSGLSKRFGDNWILKNVNLEIQEGEIVVLLGPSGIGKSTLLRCLTYLEPFQEGYVQVDTLKLKAGMDERTNHGIIRAAREQLGFVFQSFNLFPHLTVLENLTIGPVKVLNIRQEEANEGAMALLRRVGLEHKAKEYPGSLSGGQKQRVGIARALAMRPKGILFDEPTSSLDPAMKEEIIAVMENFAKDGLTMVIVTHELPFIERLATRVIELGPLGKIVSDREKTHAG